MRWIHEPDAVLFYGVRTLDVPYDDFVARVDISRVGDCFRDVLGINTEVVSRDELGRPLLQVERIAALAQPNYTSFLGKDELDVYKLEFMEYGPDEQRNSMRTICSPNSSTSADDGYLAFCRVPDPGRTRIVFVARQSFPLPRLMVLARLDRWAWLRTVLTEDAYRRFWDETVANIVARYEGRQIGVGRPHRGDRPGLLRGLGVAGPHRGRHRIRPPPHRPLETARLSAYTSERERSEPMEVSVRIPHRARWERAQRVRRPSRSMRVSIRPADRAVRLQHRILRGDIGWSRCQRQPGPTGSVFSAAPASI